MTGGSENDSQGVQYCEEADRLGTTFFVMLRWLFFYGGKRYVTVE